MSVRERSSIEARMDWRDPLGVLRVLLLTIFLLGIAGIALELVLLEHYDDFWQWTPFALFGASLVVLAWYGLTHRGAAIRVFRAVMVLFLASGAFGIFLHYDGNVEFEREMAPDVVGWPLFWEAIRGATPALAPGAMVQLGLIGLAFTLNHPALRRPAPDDSSPGRRIPS
jgi:hypothetical protein